jgi:maleate cis-trans isomerase
MYGHRARIGYTSPPAATEVFPYEFYKIVPDGVTLVINTLPLVDRTSDEVDRAYDVSLNVAHAMARAGVDIMVFGGLPINASRGFANAAEMAQATEDEIGVPVVTSLSSQRDALAILGSQKIGIIQPYDDSHGERHMTYIREMGLEPMGWECLNTTFIKLGEVDEEHVLETGRTLCRKHPEMDTVYMFCPHYAVINTIETLEQEFGVTVMTSLQAIVWNALRRCNVKDRIDGYGRLFRDF